MAERRLLSFPSPQTEPFPPGAVVLLDHLAENTIAADIQKVVEAALERVVPSSLPPEPTDYVPVIREGDLLVLPAQFFGSLIPVVTSIANGLMAFADKNKLDSIDLNLLVKAGGEVGQVPVKLSTADGDWAWGIAPGGGGGGGSLDSLVSAGSGVSLIVSQGGGIATIKSIDGGDDSVVVTTAGDNTMTITVNLATGALAGLLSPADKTKLDSVAANAQPNPPIYSGVVVGSVPAPLSLPASSARFLAEDGVWRVPAGSGGGGSFGDAPADGSTYGRNNNAWVTVDSATLDGLGDVDVGGAVDQQILRYTGGIWVASAETLPRVDQLSDAQISTLSDNDLLKYNSTLGKWVNGAAATVSGGPIALGTTLVGPVTHALVAGNIDKVIRCDISVGHVTVTLDDSIATAAGEVLASTFITENGTGVYKLQFQTATASQMPTILTSTSHSRSSGVSGDALGVHANDTRTHTTPIGTDRVLTFTVFAGRAVTTTPTDIRLTVTVAGNPAFTVGGTGGSDPAWTSKTLASEFALDIYSYSFAMGTDLVDPTSVTSQVIMNGFNTNAYVLSAIHSGFTDQVTPTESYVPGVDLNPGATVFSQLVSGTSAGANRRMIYAAVQPTLDSNTNPTAPTVSGAIQLNAGTFGNVLNRAGGGFMFAHEAAAASGAYDCTVTYPVVQDRSRLAFALRPSSVATMEIRTPGNVPAETSVTNKQVTLLYSSDSGIANLLL